MIITLLQYLFQNKPVRYLTSRKKLKNVQKNL